MNRQHAASDAPGGPDRVDIGPQRWPWPLSNAGISTAALVVMGIGVVVLVMMWLITGRAHGLERAKLQIEALKYGLGFFAASGAVAALLLSIRRQLLSEHAHELSERNHRLALQAQAHTETDAAERRVTDLYTRAVEQLGHAEAAVRLGGLYALERVAQNNPRQRQTIVNVLCAYLRMPYTPPPPVATAPVRGLSIPDTTAPADSRDPHQELQVRLTAQRILSTHLTLAPAGTAQPAATVTTSAEQSFWSDIDLDLTGAALIDWTMPRARLRNATLTNAAFTGDARFAEATFTGTARFDKATFTGTARFDRATFTGDAGFDRATFTGDARFDKATFTGTARFDRATFTGDAGFVEATFSGVAGFGGAAFSGDAGFDQATFGGVARFVDATFSGVARFGRATFSGDARFVDATFTGDAGFDRATFAGDAGFDKAAFSGATRFDEAAFSGATGFGGAAFSGDAWFGGADFAGDAWFGKATFSGDAGFDRATFTGDAWFGGTVFSSAARFDTATFSGAARFDRATFTGAARFDTATFTGDARFNRATFTGDVGFDDASFRSPPELSATSVVPRPDRTDTWPHGWRLEPGPDSGRLVREEDSVAIPPVDTTGPGSSPLA